MQTRKSGKDIIDIIVDFINSLVDLFQIVVVGLNLRTQYLFS